MALIDLLTSAGSSLINSIGSIIDKFNLSPEQKIQAEKDITDAANKHIEAMAGLAQAELDSQLRDIQNAGDLYKNNSGLQKMFAITFLIGYIVLVAVLIMLFTKDLKMPEYAIAFIGTIFGSMNMKVGTITDFLFGSSKSSQSKDETINQMAQSAVK